MKKKTLSIILIFIITLLFAVGCSKKNTDTTNGNDTVTSTEDVATDSGNTSEPVDETATPNQSSASAEGFSVVDMAGTTVEFEKTPEKIIALLASDVEILYALGAQDNITAVGEFCNYPTEASEKEVVATGENLNVEQIISLAPDVVIIGTMGQTQEQTSQLTNAGIKVVTTNSVNIEDTYEAITLLGQISGKTTEAQSMVDTMKSEFQAIKDKVAEKSDKTVYFEVSPLQYGLWTAGKDTFMQELSDLVGIKNIFDDVSGWAEVSEEQVLERNPDYIVTVSMNYENNMTPSEEILSRKNWSEVNAIKNNKVISNETDMFTRPGPRLVDAAKTLYDFVYGE